MPSAVDVLLLGSDTDRVTDAVVAACALRGIRSERMTQEQYSRSVTITMKDGLCSVEPDLPAFVRRDAHRAGTGRAASFARGEAFATVWSALAMSRSQVVNRPASTGPVDLESATQLAILRTAPGGDPLTIPVEHFASSAQDIADGHERSALTYRFTPADDDDLARMPHRFRARIPESWVHQQVVVVGERAWLRNDSHGDLDWLHRLSVEAAGRLGLRLCVLLWRISARQHCAELARVGSHPSAELLGDLLSVASSAIVEDLVG